jgi:hypothetical protein
MAFLGVAEVEGPNFCKQFAWSQSMGARGSDGIDDSWARKARERVVQTAHASNASMQFTIEDVHNSTAVFLLSHSRLEQLIRVL